MEKTKSEINFSVSLDENHVPEKIEWAATDSGEAELKEAKAMIISLWDAKENNTLRIDLWTKDMMLDEMKHFFYQSIITMSDTYERATNDKAVAEEMREFGKMIGEKMLANTKK
jgi:gliding motility-associated protein GldC